MNEILLSRPQPRWGLSHGSMPLQPIWQSGACWQGRMMLHTRDSVDKVYACGAVGMRTRPLHAATSLAAVAELACMHSAGGLGGKEGGINL